MANSAFADYTVTDLGALPGYGISVPACINNGGQVAGWATDSTGYGHAFLYSGGAMQDLGTLGGSSEALGINNSGQVVGLFVFTRSNGTTDHAFLYSGGQMQDLGTLGGVLSVAYGINDSGQIAGDAPTTSGDPHAILYSGGKMQDLGTLGGATSQSRGINDSGQVVGVSSTTSGENHAFLYSGGKMQDLNSLVGGSGWDLLSAAGINNNGQIAAYAVNGSIAHALLLTPSAAPVPAVAPITMLLLIAGLAGLISFMRRSRA